MTAVIAFTFADGTVVREDRLLNFTFRKDIYLAYTTLYASAAVDGLDPSGITEVSLFLDGLMVHHGLIDSLTVTSSGGGSIAAVSSRSFTSLLCQNQLEPGVKFGISINALMDSFYPLPYVTHEDNSDTSSYINVEKNTTMWENIVNLTYKLTGGHPFIRSTNCVRVTQVPDPQSFSYSPAQLLTTGSAISGKRLVSHFHMADISGEYGHFDYEDTEVTTAKIVRHKYFDLDMQFLREPSDALLYHDQVAFRGRRQLFCSYSGYNGEDLSDLVTFGSVQSQRICSLTVRGSSAGIITEVGVYHDKFPRQ